VLSAYATAVNQPFKSEQDFNNKMEVFESTLNDVLDLFGDTDTYFVSTGACWLCIACLFRRSVSTSLFCGQMLSWKGEKEGS